MDWIQENLQHVQERIARAAERSGRSAEEITLVAVTKTVPAEVINQAIRAGVRIIGENRVQEARQKQPEVLPVTWHMIGVLQTNKVKYAVRLFQMIQSVDRLPLAQEIEKRCQKENKVMPVLVEVNTSGEATKSGCQPEETLELVAQISELPHLRVQGLMTIGLFSRDEKAVRRCFVTLRNLAEQIRSQHIPGVSMDILSMGMSSDFEWAIEEGSTMVRIGTAIFGPRR